MFREVSAILNETGRHPGLLGRLRSRELTEGVRAGDRAGLRVVGLAVPNGAGPQAPQQQGFTQGSSGRPQVRYPPWVS